MADPLCSVYVCRSSLASVVPDSRDAAITPPADAKRSRLRSAPAYRVRPDTWPRPRNRARGRNGATEVGDDCGRQVLARRDGHVMEAIGGLSSPVRGRPVTYPAIQKLTLARTQLAAVSVSPIAFAVCGTAAALPVCLTPGSGPACGGWLPPDASEQSTGLTPTHRSAAIAKSARNTSLSARPGTRSISSALTLWVRHPLKVRLTAMAGAGVIPPDDSSIARRRLPRHTGVAGGTPAHTPVRPP